MELLYNCIANKTSVSWTEDLKEAFKILKSDLNNKVQLYLPDFAKEFYLSTDASNTSSGLC